ncbi:hypothetical protein MMUR_25600 [Mycolicibacterium murale]|uniref:Uncharacterized protein n=1 Tax=Mycolicibacterium murale TaxID=182220 RepID=A0A7I9WL53_9MYCO|nr:hypothetical protein MMUR_25600 [Mycolicibacterium murale]
MGTVPSRDRAAANGTTTAMMAVAAHKAAMTEACAVSAGRNDLAVFGTLAAELEVILRFCQ